MRFHLKVFAIAATFGVAAYGVIRVLLYVSDAAGLLDWMR